MAFVASSDKTLAPKEVVASTSFVRRGAFMGCLSNPPASSATAGGTSDISGTPEQAVATEEKKIPR